MKYIFLILVIVCSFNVFGQTNFISSINTEASYGMGAGKYGLFIKANHRWIEKEKIFFTSGISSAYFYGNDKLQTNIYNRIGFIDDLHLNFHSGMQFLFLKTNKLFLFTELYIGYYYLREKGKYESSTIVFSKNNYLVTNNLFDWGTHIGVGYYLKDNVGIQLSITNSFNDFEVFSGSKYSKLFFGMGLTYCMKGE